MHCVHRFFKGGMIIQLLTSMTSKNKNWMHKFNVYGKPEFHQEACGGTIPQYFSQVYRILMKEMSP